MQIGFFGLLTIIFIVLKLTEVIAWSWVWVLAPLWGGLVLSLVFLFVFAMCMPSTKTGLDKWR